MEHKPKTHLPVMVDEIVNRLNPQPNQTIIDATIGLGGHSLALLKKEPKLKLIGADRDKQALKKAKRRLEGYKQVECIHGNFSQLDKLVKKYVDGILFDFGLSSFQLDEPSRGFSFQKDGPLDMRMDQSETITAEEVVNNYPKHELTQIISQYGQERWAKKISSEIVQARRQKPIETTSQLKEVIEQTIPKKFWPRKIHPATKTFQAIRIEVNDELTGIKQGLESGFKLLCKGGKMVCISFHSLEDRIVKKQFKYWVKDCICPPGDPICTCDKEIEGKILTKKPIIPTKEEISKNSRARSAKMRVFQKN